jgi:hypothetical protein
MRTRVLPVVLLVLTAGVAAATATPSDEPSSFVVGDPVFVTGHGPGQSGGLGEALSRAFTQYLLPPLAIGLSGLIGAALLSLRRWLEADRKTQLVTRAVLKVDDVMATVVADIATHERAALEEAAKDGVVTADEFARLKSVAIERTKAVLGERGVAELQGAMGLGGPALEQYLSGKVETAVAAAPDSARPPSTSAAE